MSKDFWIGVDQTLNTKVELSDGSNLIHFWLFLCECSASPFPCAARL